MHLAGACAILVPSSQPALCGCECPAFRRAAAVVTIRGYEESDAARVGRSIADTYGAFNLSFLSPEERGPFLGPLQHAWPQERSHQDAIAQALQAAMMFVAERDAGCGCSPCARS
jgi:hypothetical protein